LRVGIGTENEKKFFEDRRDGGPFHGRMVKKEEDVCVCAEGGIIL
jgi:hypothetical protein